MKKEAIKLPKMKLPPKLKSLKSFAGNKSNWGADNYKALKGLKGKPGKLKSPELKKALGTLGLQTGAVGAGAGAGAAVGVGLDKYLNDNQSSTNSILPPGADPTVFELLKRISGKAVEGAKDVGQSVGDAYQSLDNPQKLTLGALLAGGGAGMVGQKIKTRQDEKQFGKMNRKERERQRRIYGAEKRASVTVAELMEKEAANLKPGLEGAKSVLGSLKGFLGNKANYGGGNYKNLYKNIQGQKSQKELLQKAMEKYRILQKGRASTLKANGINLGGFRFTDPEAIKIYANNFYNPKLSKARGQGLRAGKKALNLREGQKGLQNKALGTLGIHGAAAGGAGAGGVTLAKLLDNKPKVPEVYGDYGYGEGV